uniref:Uncharacterized protein n=1 Tax=Molossus molossus TaxID=27622 RepID=A0A7J8BYB6_MOLMO|nr:hypothetical protein HJG59_010013 [Molossus molossus]
MAILTSLQWSENKPAISTRLVFLLLLSTAKACVVAARAADTCPSSIYTFLRFTRQVSLTYLKDSLSRELENVVLPSRHTAPQTEEISITPDKAVNWRRSPSSATLPRNTKTLFLCSSPSFFRSLPPGLISTTTLRLLFSRSSKATIFLSPAIHFYPFS